VANLPARSLWCRIVYAVVDDALSLDFPLGDSLEVFIRRRSHERG
jgi:hypothetical protein